MRKLRAARRAWYEGHVRARRWAPAIGLLLATGCVAHRGAWRPSLTAHPTTPRTDAPQVELVLLANLSPEDRGARAVAERVAERIADDRPRVVLWLGNVASVPLRSSTPRALSRGPRCLPPADAWASPAASMLAEAVRPLHERGRSHAAVGVLDHRCGHREALADDAHPWALSGDHSVLRVFGDGTTRVRATCDSGSCWATRSTEVPAAPPLADLVVVDLGPWLHPRTEPEAKRQDELRVQELEALASLVTETPVGAGPPRLLVSSVPVEAAGEHGLGTMWPDGTFHTLPPALRELLVEGYFVGVLSAHDRSLSASPDLFDAIKRADRAWLRRPLFQVQAGAVSRPNRRAAMALRPRRIRESQAYRAPVLSDHAGFAVVQLRPDDATIELHARKGRRWQTTSLEVSLRPEPHPIRTPSPHMAPCRDCPPIPASER